MALNDRYFKSQFANAWTGKISDFAGLFFFPLFLCALYVLAARLMAKPSLWISPPMLLGSIFLTDLIFCAVKLSPAAATLAENVLAALGFPSRIWSDATDLTALLMNPLTYIFARRFWRVNAAEYKSNI